MAQHRDHKWQELQRAVAEAIRDNDFGQLRQLYWEIGLFVYEEGRDFRRPREESAKMELMEYKRLGLADSVEIVVAKDACPACQELRGKQFTLETALEEMPLPNRDCTFRLRGGKPGWCRCMYTPFVPETAIGAGKEPLAAGQLGEGEPPTDVPGEKALSTSERSALLDSAIGEYSNQGFQVVTRTETTAQLLKPKDFSWLFAALWFLLLGVGVLVYVFYYLAKKDTIIYLEVDPQGNVTLQK